VDRSGGRDGDGVVTGTVRSDPGQEPPGEKASWPKTPCEPAATAPGEKAARGFDSAWSPFSVAGPSGRLAVAVPGSLEPAGTATCDAHVMSRPRANRPAACRCSCTEQYASTEDMEAYGRLCSAERTGGGTCRQFPLCKSDQNFCKTWHSLRTTRSAESQAQGVSGHEQPGAGPVSRVVPDSSD
jgi:hypothetical protein